jgi:alanyl-tRNA synthetase
VDENRLRFDFTHFAKMTREEIENVEKLVSQKIRENIPIHEERSVPVEKAKEMGAMALFGEKYGETVRIIAFDKDFSVELCGGTHVPATGQIGLFRIVSEGAIAAGVRRIEAVTAGKAEEWLYEKEHLLQEIGELLKNPKDLLRGVKGLLDENAGLRTQLTELNKLRTGLIRDELLKKAVRKDIYTVICDQVDLDPEATKDLAWDLKNTVPHLFLVLASENSGKANLTVVLSDDLIRDKGMNAGAIIRELAREIGGGGGGQPHIASAGGKDPGGIPAALEKARGMIRL